MSQELLMPRATAVWLIDNTILTFSQIAEFCGMHELEIQNIADGEIEKDLIGRNPVQTGQITKEELDRCQADPSATLQLTDRGEDTPRRPSRTRYTPISKRRNKPDAIAYLIKHYPQLSPAQIERLIGTTRKTIERIREGTHRNSSMIEMKDPVLAGLCTAAELNDAIEKADAKQARQREMADQGAGRHHAAGM